MSESNEPRDVELGKSLRELPVPDHAEHFWPTVTTRLRRAAPDLADTDGHSNATTRKRPSRAWAAVPAVATLAALVAGIVFVLPRGGEDPAPVAVPPVPAMITATAVVERDGKTENFEIARASDGSLSERSLTTGDVTTYDAKARTIVTSRNENGVARVRRERNLAPGGPDPGPYSFVIDRHAEAYVIGAHRSGANTITDLMIDRRPALRYAGTVKPNPLLADGVNTIDAVVDAQTGVLRSLVRRAGRQTVSSMHLEAFEAHPAIERSRFEVNIPQDAAVEEVDRDFRALERNDDKAPREIEGFTLAGRYAHAGTAEPNGPKGANPPGKDVRLWSYRKGWHSVVVTDRRTGADDTWLNPFRPDGVVYDVEVVELDGIKGELVVEAGVLPHAWLHDDDAKSLLTVSGTASNDELVALLEMAKGA